MSATSPWNDLSGNGSNPGNDASSSSLNFALNVDYLMYFGEERLKPYFGAGLAVSMNSNESKLALANNAPNNTVSQINTGALSVGLNGIMGAEFYLYNDISLSAEYGLTVFQLMSNSDTVTNYKSASDVTTKNGSSTKILGFGAAGATLHLYF